ncbi:peptidyl-prolyl cis-trans isomerase FKBP16-4, chloroplastic isoform X1, partial [Tanacetum coccineum]
QQTTHNSILNEELLSKKDALGERHLTLEHEVATLNEQLQRERELRKPYGFDVGESERGNVLKGLDLGVQGMRIGGHQVLIVPPEIVYGSKGVQEIPPNATIE